MCQAPVLPPARRRIRGSKSRSEVGFKQRPTSNLMKKAPVPPALRLRRACGELGSVEIDQWIARHLNNQYNPLRFLVSTPSFGRRSAVQVVSSSPTKGGVGLKRRTAANLGELARGREAARHQLLDLDVQQRCPLTAIILHFSSIYELLAFNEEHGDQKLIRARSSPGTGIGHTLALSGRVEHLAACTGWAPASTSCRCWRRSAT